MLVHGWFIGWGSLGGAVQSQFICGLEGANSKTILALLSLHSHPKKWSQESLSLTHFYKAWFLLLPCPALSKRGWELGLRDGQPPRQKKKKPSII